VPSRVSFYLGRRWFVIFSWAGEKMPWLTMHFAIPLAFVAGWAIDKLLDIDWRDLLARGAIWLGLLIPLALVLLASVIFGARAFSRHGARATQRDKRIVSFRFCCCSY